MKTMTVTVNYFIFTCDADKESLLQIGMGLLKFAKIHMKLKLELKLSMNSFTSSSIAWQCGVHVMFQLPILLISKPPHERVCKSRKCL